MPEQNWDPKKATRVRIGYDLPLVRHRIEDEPPHQADDLRAQALEEPRMPMLDWRLISRPAKLRMPNPDPGLVLKWLVVFSFIAIIIGQMLSHRDAPPAFPPPSQSYAPIYYPTSCGLVPAKISCGDGNVVTVGP